MDQLLEEYEEEDPLAPSPLPLTKRLQLAQLEKDISEVSSNSDEHDPTGKTQEQLDEMIAKYRRDSKASRMEANWRSALKVLNVPNVFNLLSDAHVSFQQRRNRKLLGTRKFSCKKKSENEVFYHQGSGMASQRQQVDQYH